MTRARPRVQRGERAICHGCPAEPTGLVGPPASPYDDNRYPSGPAPGHLGNRTADGSYPDDMTLQLPLQLTRDGGVPLASPSENQRAAIEVDAFPFEAFCAVAEMESWRKEINRPLYHLHKWWARRLGSVFRAIVIGTLAEEGTDVEDSFYRPTRFPGAIVFDPFMGAGTTLGEALKLGCQVIGRDINPVAYFVVKNALARHSRDRVIAEFKAIERDVSAPIQHYYEAKLPTGERAQSLYYFWVKTLKCPECSRPVDLFSSYVFARHAYPRKHPTAQAVCPSCSEVNETRYDATHIVCRSCQHHYNPQRGPAQRASVTCPRCHRTSRIIEVLRESGRPPRHRLFAKLVLTAAGQKRYLSADDFDQVRFREAVSALEGSGDGFRGGALEPGYNTNQALNYGYRYWHEMFNERQLLCLGILAERIRLIERGPLRDLFTCLFSGALEFNNMFASYKGEGTGAVRHMFSHHVLKPERTPLEANLWGTPKSSGAFSTLFRGRIIRALDYCENPFEIKVSDENGRRRTQRVFGLSDPIGFPISETFAALEKGERIYLSCGDSSETDLPANSVDAVITDPPFFDNVHYSELADFFYSWQRHILGTTVEQPLTTRSNREVQHKDAETFANRLRAVLLECNRVLKPRGLLVFTYHHSRHEGWHSVLDAIIEAGFVIVAAHPIKAEMSVATPKRQAREPIDLDIILVCRRREDAALTVIGHEEAWKRGVDIAAAQIRRLRDVGRTLSRNDVAIVVSAQVVRFLSSSTGWETAHPFLKSCRDRIDAVVTAWTDRHQG